MHYRYYSTKLQVFQEYLAPRRVLVLIQVGVASLREFRALREYTHTLRLVSKLPDLRVGYANPYPKRFAFWAGATADGSPENEKSTSFEVLHSLVTHPGIEPEFPA